MSSEDPRRKALRRRREETETELRNLDYGTERCVAHPGSTISNQIFNEEILLLLLLGSLSAQVEQETVELRPGDRLRVPDGVPFSIRVLGESTAYWIQASRKETAEGPSREQSPNRP